MMRARRDPALRLVRHLAAALLAVVVLAGAEPAHALKIASYNLSKYPETSIAARQAHFRTVMAAMDPDILIAQELTSAAGRDSFLNNVLDVIQPGQWSATSYVVLDVFEGGAIFYKTAKVTVFNVVAIATGGPRDALLAGIRPAGYGAASFFRVYSNHFKAGSTPSDESTRATEGAGLRNLLNAVPASQPFIVGGDFNFQGATEQGFLRLTESQADNDGRCTDPLNLSGTWHLNFDYRLHHTQSPCQSGCLGSGGGMDDRFDLWLASTTMRDGQGFDYVTGSYLAFGNDGQHYNDAIDGGGFNNAVGLTVASALRQASDHLPVMISIQVPAKVSAVSQLDVGTVITGSIPFAVLLVGNSAVPPADVLDYSLATSSEFSTDAGGAVGTGAFNPHLVFMDTSTPGTVSGTLTISSDDPDSSNKQVQLSGLVLRHASPSLDSLSTLMADTLDFGQHLIGDFEDIDLCVHNLGYDALQARLAVGSTEITGGGGRFSLVSGTAPTLLSGDGETYRVHFDDAGATHDSLYQADLTITVADEDLYGQQSYAPLTVRLMARPLTALGVPGPTPAAIAFDPAQPNPVRGETLLRFALPEAAPVRLSIFDLSGRRVRVLASGRYEAGIHELRWRGESDQGVKLPPGVYLARFETLGAARTQRIALLP